MRLTIITATYNSAKTLNTCIQSITDQNYRNIEYVIVDGGSNDDTVSIIKENQKQFSNLHWVSEKDKGIYDALNKGIAMATGDFIGFVHSDDLLAHPKILSHIMQTFKNKKVDGVYGDLLYVDKTSINKVIRVWKSCMFQPKLLKQGWMPAHPTLFLKKAVYLRHGNFNLAYKIAADYDFMLRVLKDESFSFSYLPKVITKMRVGGASNRSLKSIIQKSKEDYRAIKTNGLSYPLWVLIAKNISKIPQFF